jgi:PIN domain nuclease of toxin-antitoxin system
MGGLEVILIDTHIWVWWVNDSTDMPDAHRQGIEDSRTDGIGVSAISCWEVAKLVEKGKLALSEPLDRWMTMALSQQGVLLVPLLPEIAVESTRLPGVFHKDPADQIIVATSRFHDISLMTLDTQILSYPHVRLWTPPGP